MFITVIFKDGFETGDFLSWTSSYSEETFSVVNTAKHHGTYSAYINLTTNTGDALYYYTMTGPPFTLYIRCYLDVLSTSMFGYDDDFAPAVGFQSDLVTNEISMCGLGRTGGTERYAIQYRSSGAWLIAFSATTPTLGWHCLELKHKISTGASTDGEEHLFVDGTELIAVTGISNNDRTLRDAILGGYFRAGASELFQYYVDCVVVADRKIGCEKPLFHILRGRGGDKRLTLRSHMRHTRPPHY